jgi:excisionase family DNA binding protein
MRESLLNVRQVSGILSVHPKTLYHWKKSGRLPAVSINGRVRFERSRIDEFIERANRKLIDPEAIFPKVALPLDSYDRIHLKGGKGALKNKTRRWNYGFGTVYLRKTEGRPDHWYIEYRDQGKRIREAVKGAHNRGEALIALQSRVAEIFDGRFAPQRTAEQTGLREFAERFLNEYAKSEKTSWKTDEYRLRRILEFFGEFKMPAVTEVKIREFRELRLREGCSKLTANRYLALLKKMFNWGISRGLLKTNPVKAVKMFSEADTARDRVLRPDEEERLFAELAPRIRPVILAMLHTGLRYREALFLTWDGVDLQRRRIKVEKTKSKHARFVPINSTLLDVLEELRACSMGPRVFPFQNIRTGFENACERAGLADFTFHDLRRTFGTRLLERGADIVTIQKLYGHSSVLVTQHYLHPNDELSVEAVELLAGSPGEKTSKPEKVSQNGHKTVPSSFAVPVKTDLSVN